MKGPMARRTLAVSVFIVAMVAFAQRAGWMKPLGRSADQRAFEAIQQAAEDEKQEAQREREMQQDAWGNPLPRQSQDVDTPPSPRTTP